MNFFAWIYTNIKNIIYSKKININCNEVVDNVGSSVTRDSYIRSPSPIESELKYLFSENDNLIIFDVGSCEGEDSIRYALMFPLAKVFAFEPLPNNLLMLNSQIDNYSLRARIEIFPVALSDTSGILQFYVSSGQPENLKNSPEWDYGNKAGSLLQPDQVINHYPWLVFGETIDVIADTFENVCNKNSIESVDLVHMDVQGAELKVLMGANNHLHKVKCIWLEVENVSLYKDQPLSDEVESFMILNGFRKIKDTVTDVTGDHFYVNSRYF